jgi:hypothetical protein
VQGFGRAVADLPELPPPLENDENEGEGQENAQALDMGPVEDTTPQERLALPAPSRTGTRQAKRSHEELATGSSGATNKRPRRACTLRIGTILIGEHQLVLLYQVCTYLNNHHR